eukprot:1189911-Prorocentrum_minimum.AAC.3
MNFLNKIPSRRRFRNSTDRKDEPVAEVPEAAEKRFSEASINQFARDTFRWMHLASTNAY